MTYAPTTTETPILSLEREVQLIAEARAGSASAKQELVSAHLRLVRAIARRVTPRPTEDTLAEGTLALVEAFERFDPSFGVRFSTYAAHWVRALVTRHVLANRRMVPPPSTRAARRVFAGLGRAERKLSATDPCPSSERIATELGVTAADVEEVVASTRGRDVSIGPAPEGFADVDPPSEVDSPEDLVAHAQERERTSRALHDALARLPLRERHIVEARRYAEGSRTLDDLASELALSRERVRQLERRALDRLGVELRGAA
jgi:RNA polymerase sigma factor (sigma-70 family)